MTFAELPVGAVFRFAGEPDSDYSVKTEPSYDVAGNEYNTMVHYWSVSGTNEARAFVYDHLIIIPE